MSFGVLALNRLVVGLPDDVRKRETDVALVRRPKAIVAVSLESIAYVLAVEQRRARSCFAPSQRVFYRWSLLGIHVY